MVTRAQSLDMIQNISLLDQDFVVGSVGTRAHDLTISSDLNNVVGSAVTRAQSLYMME